MPIPLPVITGVYRCAFKWLHSDGQRAVNVLHLDVNAGSVPAADVFELLQDTVTTNMWYSVVNSAAIVEVDITPLDGVSSSTSFPTGAGAQWTGGSAGESEPGVAVVVKFQTGIRGVANRGRVFLPFTAEGNGSNGFLTPGNDTICTAAWTTFIAALQADATTPSALVVAAYDRKHGGASAHDTAVTVATCEAAYGTMRRRQNRNRRLV